MFGLTKREQRWKAEQKAAEVLADLAAVALQSAAQVRVAEALADAKVAAERERCAAECRKMRDALNEASPLDGSRAAVAEELERRILAAQKGAV